MRSVTSSRTTDKLNIVLVIAAALVAMTFSSRAQVMANGEPDTGDANDGKKLVQAGAPDASKRMQWWSEARFGMFIHWGLYSQWGCHYPGTNGDLLNGSSEHMMRHLRIPLTNYAKIADIFSPTNFSADEWVGIARDAGMKYIVITTKHHDGFAMYDSPSSDYNIVKHTPWHRDPVKELADACRRQGLKFGVYYSLGRDWEDPDVPTDLKPDGTRRSNDWDWPDETKKDFSRYFERKVKPQMTELLTQYHPAIVWFDTPEKINRSQSQELLDLIRRLQPDCVVNARIGSRLGDYAVSEQSIPKSGDVQPWETCMTLNRHWGYFLGDEEWKPAKMCITNLADIVSKGGNYLLNVGPTGDGIIPKGAVDDLRQVGAWMKVNGESIYGTTASTKAVQRAHCSGISSPAEISRPTFDSVVRCSSTMVERQNAATTRNPVTQPKISTTLTTAQEALAWLSRPASFISARPRKASTGTETSASGPQP